MTPSPVIPSVSDPILHTAGQLRLALAGWPPGLVAVILLAGAVLAAWLAYALLIRVVPARLRRNRPGLDLLVRRARRPLFCGLVIVFLAAVVPATPLGPLARADILYALSAGFVLLLGWAALIGIDLLAGRELLRRSGDIQNDPMARRHATQWQVLRRAANVLTIMVTVAAALMAFPGVRTYGVSLLASAGAAGLILGLAARPLLSNLIAGIQIAMTQPLRIEDAVVINGQWGWIEEITSTYVVVRIWNWQRMVVPLAWLLDNPFQNWTRDSAELIGEVHWLLDYTAPLEAMRGKLDEIVHASKLWSGKVVVLQVTHALAQTMELRALVSARNSSEAWDLRCLVREQMIAFLQAEYPHALPKQRLELEPGAPTDAGRKMRTAA